MNDMEWLYSGPIPSKTNYKRKKPKNYTRGERNIAFIERYLKVPEGSKVGQPIKLDEFQKRFILAVYDNPNTTESAILSISRKNGKSALISSLLIVNLIGPEAVRNSQIVSGAMSREQAGIIFNLAAKMLRLSPDLQDFVKIRDSQKRIIGTLMNTEYKALSSEGKTAHGLSPVLAILDEVGQIRGPKSEFVDAITTAQGAHDSPLLMTISTQAAQDNDLLSLWIDDCKNNRDENKSRVCHVYTSTPECDLLDEDEWRKSNPALGSFRSIRDIRKQAKDANRMPSQANTFRNLILNQRVEVNAPFISKGVWDGNQGEFSEDMFRSGKIYGGLDLSARIDLTSLVLISLIDDRVLVKSYFWTPADTIRERSKSDRQPYNTWIRDGYLRALAGKSISYQQVAEEIRDISGSYDIEQIAFDKWRIDSLETELDRMSIDLPLVKFSQGYAAMSPAMDELETYLLDERMIVEYNPVMTMCVANATVIQDTSGNRKMDKSKKTGRIDGAVALTMAVGASTAQKTEKKYTKPIMYL